MKIALLQMQGGIQPETNCTTLVEAIAYAADNGAAMLFTPEMSGLLDANRKRAAIHLATEEADAVLSELKRAADAYGIWLHIGSLALVDGSRPDRMVNRGFVIDDCGTVQARYDKIHLFDVDLDTGESWRESAVYNAGDQPAVVETPFGKLGLSICYDIRFPALYTELTDSGAVALTIPAAFTVPTGKAHWQELLRARAIENAAYVIAAAQSGVHEDGRETYGHSMVIDPWGEVVLDMDDTIGVGFTDINIEHVAEVRRRIPVIDHRKSIAKASVLP